MITVFGRRNSSNVAKVLWSLDHLQVPYQQIDMGLGFGGNDTPEFLAMNPNGKVPVLKDGEASIWESNAIVRYVGAVYGNDAFWPHDPLQRAKTDGWMDWATTAFYRPVLLAYRANKDASANRDSVRSLIETTKPASAILNQHLSTRDYVMGDALSAADIAIGVHIARFVEIEELAEMFRSIRDYHSRLLKLPAYQLHVQTALVG